MLKRFSLIFFVTLVSVLLAIGDFFFMRSIPRNVALVYHNVLASLVGVGFVYAYLQINKKMEKPSLFSLFILAIGVAMLGLHVVRVFIVRC